MKLHIASLAILCLALAVVPASAQTLWSNGPINGNTEAWTINFGYVVSDSFTVPYLHQWETTTVTGFDFGVWEFPHDELSSVDWSITTAEFGGTTYGSGTANGSNLTDTYISTNGYGYNIDLITVSGLNINLGSGTYWLNLANAVVPSGNPVYWDENSGVGCGGYDGNGGGCPSQASESILGTIPSEPFDINGNTSYTFLPEPGSIVLFGSGVICLAGLLRRKLF